MGKKINFQPILSLQTNSSIGGNDKLVVVIDTRGMLSLNGKTTLLAISDISQSKTTYLDFENFNIVEIDQATSKYFIGGKVYLTLEKDVLTKTLIAEIKYDVTKLKADYSNEGLLVNDLNQRIKSDWNDAFNSALKLSFQSKIQNPTVETTKKTVGNSSSLFKKFNIATFKKNKTKTALFVFMGVLVALNLSYLFSKANNQQQNATVSLLSAEAMAQQQEELLDKAFSDIGIDRSKLASDISCFTE